MTGSESPDATDAVPANDPGSAAADRPGSAPADALDADALPAPLLLGYDGSDGAKAALAAFAALWPQRPLVLATAWVPVGDVGRRGALGVYLDIITIDGNPIDERTLAEAERTAREGADAALALGLRVQRELVLRAPDGVASALAGAAREHDASALIVGRTASGTLTEALLGSVPRELARSAGRPLAIVPPECVEAAFAAGAGASGPVLLTCDGSAASREALRCSAALFAGREAVVLRAWRASSALAPFDPAALGSELVARLSGLSRELDAEIERAAQRDAEQGAGIARAVGAEAGARAVEGRPSRAILDAAAELHAAAIALGAHAEHGGMPIGSTAARVLHHARCPVLLAPASHRP